MNLHEFLDCHYGPDGEQVLRQLLADGADLEEPRGPRAETPLHVATRRFRPAALGILLDAGASKDARTAGGKTAYIHAVRRGFAPLAELLVQHGARTDLEDADRFAVAVVHGRLEEAREILSRHPQVARTGNPEEDRLLIDAGAPLDVFDATHHGSPIGWVTHGSRYSGGVEQRQDAYVAVARILLEAGSSLHDPDDPQGDAYWQRLLHDASPPVRQVLEDHVQESP